MISRSASRPVNRPLLYLAAALTSAGTLVLALAMSRLLKVVFDRDVAWMLVCLASVGVGAGSSLSGRIAGEQPFRRLGWVGLATGLTAMLSATAAVVRYPNAIAVGLLLALAFGGAGAMLGTAVTQAMVRLGKVCGYVFVGAACGCWGLVALLNSIGAPNTVMAVAVTFAAASAIWFGLGGARRGRILSVAIGLFLTMLVMANMGLRVLEVHYKDGVALRERFVRWNWISRASVAEASDGSGALGVDGKLEPFGYPRAAPAARGPRVIATNAGGGSVVAEALESGSPEVVVAEPNHAIVSIMRDRYPELSGRLYLRPEIHLVEENGASFLGRTEEHYRRVSGAENGAGNKSTRTPTWWLGALGFCLVVVLAMGAAGGLRIAHVSFPLTGLGYALVAGALMSQVENLTGHPVYGLTMGLAAMLLATGAGSIAGRTIMPDNPRLAVMGAAVIVTVTALLLPATISLCFHLPFEIRAGIACAAGLPAGFTMGLVLPAALSGCGESAAKGLGLHAAAIGTGILLLAVLSPIIGATAIMLIGAALFIVAFAVPETTA